MMRVARLIGLAIALSVLVGLGGNGSAATVDRPGPAAQATFSESCGGPCMLFLTRFGAGMVKDDAGWLNCGSTCQAGYGEGDRVTLTATPDPGQTFLRWSGCTETLADGRCLVVTWGIDCVEAHFTGAGSTMPGWGCAPNTNPPAPPAPPAAEAADHPPLGTRCTIVGSPYADVIQGTFAADVICGGGGNDRISGGGGHDLILGGKGNDRLYGGAGREHLLGGPGDDTLVGGPDDDELFGQAGADLLLARDGVADWVNGGRGRDRARLDRADYFRGVERRL